MRHGLFQYKCYFVVNTARFDAFFDQMFHERREGGLDQMFSKFVSWWVHGTRALRQTGVIGGQHQAFGLRAADRQTWLHAQSIAEGQMIANAPVSAICDRSLRQACEGCQPTGMPMLRDPDWWSRCR